MDYIALGFLDFVEEDNTKGVRRLGHSQNEVVERGPFICSLVCSRHTKHLIRMSELTAINLQEGIFTGLVHQLR